MALGLLEFIHAKADAPPTGLLDDLGIVAIVRGAFCSSELTRLDSHLRGAFSTPPGWLWLFRLVSPEERAGVGSEAVPVRAAEDERLVIGAVVEEEAAFEGLRTFMFLPPLVAF